MFANNGLISTRQLNMLLILYIFAKSITTLPKKVAEMGGHNGWVLILIATVFAIICLYFINFICKLNPNLSFFDNICKIIGRPLAIIICIGFLIKILIGTAFEVRLFCEVLKELILFNTPIGIVAISMILVGGYMASKGYEARGRMSELLIFIVFIPLIFVCLVTIFDVDFNNLRPIFREISSTQVIEGGFSTLFYFSGIEFIFFVYPYVNDGEKKKIQKNTISSLILVGIIITLISILTIARFGVKDLTHQMWAVLEMMDTLDIPGSFIERQDSLIMLFWIVAIFVIINTGIFFSSIMAKDILKKGKHINYIWVFMVIIYILSFMPKNISKVYEFFNIYNYTFELFYILILPVMLFIIAKIRGLKCA